MRLALFCHALQKAVLAIGAIQLVGTAAEVASRRSLAQPLPLALIGLSGVFGAAVERRIAEGKVEQLVGCNDAVEDLLRLGLSAQLDLWLQSRVGCNDLLAVAQRVGINVAADKLPAVFSIADQGINQIRAGAHIQPA